MQLGFSCQTDCSLVNLCRVSTAQAGTGDDHATALTSSPHGIVQHRGRGRDLAALQEQVIAKLGRQVWQSYTLTEKRKRKKTT